MRINKNNFIINKGVILVIELNYIVLVIELNR